MAEFVEFRTEEMVNELELLERHRIFTEAEIRLIIKTRRSFQYKIQRRTKCMEDFVRYIQYEMDLMQLVKSRGNKLGPVEGKNKVYMMIGSRVNKLFEQALSKFNDNINLWLSYMKYCKQMKAFSGSVSNMLVNMLGVHSHKPSLWKLAANWEFEEQKSIENSCQFIMRGLRHHPNSKMLYTEAFRLELIYTDVKRKELKLKDNEVKEVPELIPPPTSSASAPACHVPTESVQVATSSGPFSLDVVSQLPERLHEPAILYDTLGNVSSDTILDCRNAEFIYASARNKFFKPSFLIGLLNIAKNFSFTENLQSRIAKDLLTNFPNDELTWDVLAHWELEGLQLISKKYTEEGEEMKRMDISDEPTASNVPRKKIERVHYLRIRKCFAVYQRGLQYVNTNRMWELYLDALIKLNQDPILRKVKRKLLNDAFQSAEDEDHMQEKYYIYWANMDRVAEENTGIILLKGTGKFPSSVELWQQRLNFHLLRNEDEMAMSVFQQAVASLDSNAPTLPIWKTALQFWERKSVNVVKDLFEEGIRQGPAVASVLKQMYLEWLVSAEGIHAARVVYDTICIQPPFCRALLNKMVELESLQPKVKMSRIVKCYELACEQFGKNNTDVWLEYVQFEANRGDPKKIQEIYQRALKTLDENIAHDFISNFCDYWVVRNLKD